jgi:hypothetical protein
MECEDPCREGGNVLGASEKKQWIVKTFEDYVNVADELETKYGVLGKDKIVAVLIGCSAHSPIQRPKLQDISHQIGNLSG